MNNFSQRRIDVATCWATNRIAVLDSLENYEESFAILEEFKEWITNIGNSKDELSHYVMKFPSDINKYINKSIKDLD
tara:strand:- start:56 stop:286 length:231 start_codon:yes stop_codon:yes gene_type:complete